MMSESAVSPTALRVLFVAHWFPRHDLDWGGIFVLEQAQVLRAAGVDVRVLSAEPMPDIAWRRPSAILGGVRDWMAASPPTWQTQRGVPVAYVPFLTPHPRFWGAFAPRAYIASLIRWTRALLADFAPDVVHAHAAFIDASAAAWIARRLRIPMVLTEGTGPFSSIMRTAGQRRIVRKAVRASDLLLPVSDFQRRAIEDATGPHRNAAILGNGFDPAVFRPSASPGVSPMRFVWIGRMDDNKQPLLLLDAFSSALDVRDDLRLTLIGHGPLAEAVRSRIATPALAGKVEFRPSMDRAGIAAALQEHGALVISSRNETFGVVAIEALGSGRPVLTTCCGGPEEIIAAIGGGLVVGNSAQGLARGFIDMANSAAEYDPWTLASAAEATYAFDKLARRLIGHYAALRERPQRA